MFILHPEVHTGKMHAIWVCFKIFQQRKKEQIKMWLKTDSSYTLILSIWRIFALLFLPLSIFQIFINKESDWITQKAFLWGWHWLCDLGQGFNTSKTFLMSEKRLISIYATHPPSWNRNYEVHMQQWDWVGIHLIFPEARMDKMQCPSYSP